jgi:hypothetical protein
MTYEHGVRIASRSLSLYTFILALSSALQIPREISAVFTQLAYSNAPHANEASQRIATAAVTSAIGYLAGSIVGAVIWTVAGLILFRCGKTVQRFFGLAASEPAARPQFDSLLPKI